MDFKSLLSKLDVIGSKKNLNEGWDDMMKASKERADKDKKEKGTGKFDKKETGTGTVYTRKSSTFDDGGEDKDTKKAKEKAKKAKVKEGETDLDEGFGDMVKKGVDTAKKVGNAALTKLGHGSDEDLIKDMQKKAGVPQTGKKPEQVSEETVEEDDVEEGNEFSGARDAAIKAGKKEFSVGGKTYQVKESKKPDDDGDGIPNWADKESDKDDTESDDKKDDSKKDKKDKKEKVDESLEECYDQAMGQMQQQESGMNISSNMDTKTGNQSLTVTAQGPAADQLAQLLKLSGVLGSTKGSEVEVEVDEAGYANEPQTQMQGIDAQLQQGNDLNRPKATYPKVAGGDNPMQRAIAAMEARAQADLDNLERKLMEQLDSLKVVTKKK